MNHAPRVQAVGCAAVAVAVALAGCSAGSAPGTPRAAAVPLVAGARIVAQARRCDGGAHAYCARQLVIVAARRASAGGRGYAGPYALRAAEAALLHRVGWAISKGDTDDESMAESPNHRIRVMYATAADDLRSADQGRITRAGTIVHALSETMFARAPALSLLIQAGSAA